MEFVGQALFLNLSGVINDAAVQLVDVFEAVVLQETGGLFAADAAGAVEQNRGFFLALEQIQHLRELLAEGFCLRGKGSFKPTDLAFVVVADVHHHRIGMVHELVPLGGGDVPADVRDVVGAQRKAVGQNVGTGFNLQFEEAFAVVFHGDFEGHAREFRPGVQFFHEAVPVVCRNVHLGVDAFVRYVDSAQTLQRIPLGVQAVPNLGRLVQVDVAVKAEGASGKGLRIKPCLQGFAVVFVGQMPSGLWEIFHHCTKVLHSI